MNDGRAEERARIVERVSCFVLPFLFTAFIGAHGIPILRHDWAWPRAPFEVWSFYTLSSSGWDPIGLGFPNAIPMGYISALPIAAVSFVAGPYVALVLFLYAIALNCVVNISSLAKRVGAGPVAAIAAQILVLFNPWVYNKVVAGHLLMVLAYGSIAGIVAALAWPRRNATRIVSLQMILCAGQLQFFLPCFVLVVLWSLRRRLWLPLVTTCIIALPEVFGLIFYRANLFGTAYNLQWQLIQSVKPLDAIALTGYASNYVRDLSWIQLAGLYVVAAMAAAGAFIPRPSHKALLVACAAGAALLFATGAKGPIASLYLSIVAHLKISGVYRELYDVLGVVGLAYVALALRASRQNVILSGLLCLASLVIASYWLVRPPATYWIASHAVPISVPPPVANTRYALFPAFQPLSYMGRGSGADPDLVVVSSNFSPLNAYLPLYPEDVALARFERERNTDGLTALSVSRIRMREGFVGSARAIAGNPEVGGQQFPNATLDVSAEPELSVGEAPGIGTLTSNFGAGNVFFADAPCELWCGNASASARAISVPVAATDPTRDWIDARLMFSSKPELAQPFGGAFTGSTAVLRVGPADRVLARVDGKLIGADGRMLSAGTNGYRWISLSGESGVRCIGECAVALEGSPPALPLNPSKRAQQPLTFMSPVPWLALSSTARASVNVAILRYNVRFDPYWIAVENFSILKHVRIDGITNGWILPETIAPGRIILLHVGAFIQFLAELFAYGWMAILFVRFARSRRQERW